MDLKILHITWYSVWRTLQLQFLIPFMPCIVLFYAENIHSPFTFFFCFDYAPSNLFRNFSFGSIAFLSKLWLLKPSSFFKFPITHSGWALVFSGATHICVTGQSCTLSSCQVGSQGAHGANSMLTEHIFRRLSVGMCLK